MVGMVLFLIYAQILFYVWQMLFLILGIAAPLILVYTSIGIWLLKRTPKRKAGDQR